MIIPFFRTFQTIPIMKIQNVLIILSVRYHGHILQNLVAKQTNWNCIENNALNLSKSMQSKTYLWSIVNGKSLKHYSWGGLSTICNKLGGLYLDVGTYAKKPKCTTFIAVIVLFKLKLVLHSYQNNFLQPNASRNLSLLRTRLFGVHGKFFTFKTVDVLEESF